MQTINTVRLWRVKSIVKHRPNRLMLFMSLHIHINLFTNNSQYLYIFNKHIYADVYAAHLHMYL